jgi:hypothetical protein
MCFLSLSTFQISHLIIKYFLIRSDDRLFTLSLRIPRLILPIPRVKPIPPSSKVSYWLTCSATSTYPLYPIVKHLFHYHTHKNQLSKNKNRTAQEIRTLWHGPQSSIRGAETAAGTHTHIPYGRCRNVRRFVSTIQLLPHPTVNRFISFLSYPLLFYRSYRSLLAITLSSDSAFVVLCKSFTNSLTNTRYVLSNLLNYARHSVF